MPDYNFWFRAIIVAQIEIDARSRSLMPVRPPLAARLIWAEDNGRRNHDLYLSFRALCSVNFPLTAECRIQCRLVEKQQQLSNKNPLFNEFHILVAIKIDVKIFALQQTTLALEYHCTYLLARGRMSEQSDTVSVNIAAQTTPGILAGEREANRTIGVIFPPSSYPDTKWRIISSTSGVNNKWRL